ncbi:MAG: zf-HC2 domain-containing protein [Acidobacteriota bacterium]
MNEHELSAGSFRCPLQEGEQAGTFLAWMDGTLSREETAVLELHARDCASCRAVVEGHKAVWSAMDAWAPAEVSQDFNRRLYSAIDAQQAQPWWKRAMGALMPFPVRPAIPIAASCLLVIGVALFRAPEPVELETKQAGIIERMDVEQVDRSLDDLNLLRELNEELQLEPPAKSL